MITIISLEFIVATTEEWSRTCWTGLGEDCKYTEKPVRKFSETLLKRNATEKRLVPDESKRMDYHPSIQRIQQRMYFSIHLEIGHENCSTSWARMKEKMMEQFIGIQCLQNYWQHTKIRVDESIQAEIGFITFIGEATIQRFEHCQNSKNWYTLERFRDTLVVLLLCLNWWGMFQFPTIGRNSSSTEVQRLTTGQLSKLNSWLEGRKAKKEDKPFSSQSSILLEVIRIKKNQVKITQNLERSLYDSSWRRNQNAKYWVNLSRAQDHGLQFWQTKSNAIEVHDSVPDNSIERVVGWWWISNPMPENFYTSPKIILRNKWQASQPAAAAAAATATIFPRVVQALGNRCEKVIKMKHGLREIPWLQKPQVTGNRYEPTTSGWTTFRKKNTQRQATHEKCLQKSCRAEGRVEV